MASLLTFAVCLIRRAATSGISADAGSFSSGSTHQKSAVSCAVFPSTCARKASRLGQKSLAEQGKNTQRRSMLRYDCFVLMYNPFQSFRI